MITKTFDDTGRIIGYIEWRQVAKSGFDKLYGEYVWINDMWIHEDYRDKPEYFRNMVSEILYKAPDAKWCYFQRRKYRGRMRQYSREKFEKLAMKGLVII